MKQLIEFVYNLTGIELYVQAIVHERPTATPDGEPDEGWDIEIECVWCDSIDGRRIPVDWESLSYKGVDLNELLIEAAIRRAEDNYHD